MIIINGHIKGKTKTPGGFDDDGNPIKPVEAWSDSIPCRYVPNRNSLKGKQNGNAFTIASFEVYVEAQDFPFEQLRLIDLSGVQIGDYSIMWKEFLDAVNAIKITI